VQEAINEYKRAIQMDPKVTVDAHYYLGTAYEQLKKPADALHEYKEYLRLAPTGQNAKDCRDRIKVLEPHK
jgi:tetratricopeptide (TPR) repeat protein